MTYFAQENESSIEVCVVSEGYGFTADIITVDVTANGNNKTSQSLVKSNSLSFIRLQVVRTSLLSAKHLTLMKWLLHVVLTF